MQNEITQSRRSQKWRLAIRVVAVIAVVAAGSVVFGPRVIHFYFIAQAEKLLDRKNYKSAEAPIRRALKFMPDSIQACEMMADLARGANSPEELVWRRKLAALQPENSAVQLRLAVSASRYGELSLASAALKTVPEKDHNQEFHTAAGTVAYSLGNLELAGKHFSAAYEMSPDDPGARLNHEKVRLAAKDTLTRTLAIDAIKDLTQDTAYRLRAYRILLNDAVRSGDLDTKKKIHKILRDLPESSFLDRLLYLSDLHSAKDPEFPKELAKRENDAILAPENVFDLMAWMNGASLFEATMAWYEKLPISIQLLPSTKLVVAEAGIALHAWDKVEKLVAPPSWYHLEHLRQAIQARCYIARHGYRDEAFTNLWTAAREEAGDEYRKVQMLARLTQAWEWWAESEQLWWQLVEKPDAAVPTLKHLYKTYLGQGNTVKLLQVSKRMLELEPDNIQTSNDVVRYSLLRGEATPAICEMARANAQKAPRDWGVRTTYALALLFEDKAEEAGAFLKDAPASVEREPKLAPYFGITFALSGRKERARPLLLLAKEAKVLPEEQSLVLQALALQ